MFIVTSVGSVCYKCSVASVCSCDVLGQHACVHVHVHPVGWWQECAESGGVAAIVSLLIVTGPWAPVAYLATYSVISRPAKECA